jgi:methylmalonyl-CoA mutase C-terminal domain/subunit
LFPRIVEELDQRGAGDVLVFAGGIIPDADIPQLRKLGVAGIFGPGAPLGDITSWLEAELDKREGTEGSEP